MWTHSAVVTIVFDKLHARTCLTKVTAQNGSGCKVTHAVVPWLHVNKKNVNFYRSSNAVGNNFIVGHVDLPKYKFTK